jgi:hypothetical protein
MRSERIKRSKGDTAHALVRAAASAVPVAGGPLAELFAYLIEEPLSKRRDAWIEEIAGRVADLEGRVAKPLADELKDNEAFTTVLLSASQIAVRNHQREKIDALANAVLNTGLGLAPDETERAIMRKHPVSTAGGAPPSGGLRVLLARRLPAPRQQLLNAARRVIGDAGENVGQPRARIDVAELGRLNQGEDHRGALAAGIRAAEGPVAPANRNRTVILPISGSMS